MKAAKNKKIKVKYISLKKAAETLGLPKNYLAFFYRNKRLGAVKINKKWLIAFQKAIFNLLILKELLRCSPSFFNDFLLKLKSQATAKKRQIIGQTRIKKKQVIKQAIIIRRQIVKQIIIANKRTAKQAIIIKKQVGGQPVSMFVYPIWFLIFTVILSVGVGLIAGIWPAKRAANLNPLEALRYK